MLRKNDAPTLVGRTFTDEDGDLMEVVAVTLDDRHDAGYGFPDRSTVRAQRVGNTDPDDMVAYGLFDVLNQFN
jgi:hypothetical protein